MRQISLIALLSTTTYISTAAEIKTSIIIKATPEQVWAELTDFAAYASWNPFLKEVSGEVAVGKKIKINADGMTFKPKVLVFDAHKELKWIGRLILPGIFDGTHRFVLIDNGDGTTTLEHSEDFSGILVPLFKKKLLKETKANFEAMNQKLKERVEQRYNTTLSTMN